ncbi:MAG: serine/threonine protein kinase [Gemmataceae bacterium]|nr:serine/threonine protein kinase [Gemmataceae bacterium]
MPNDPTIRPGAAKPGGAKPGSAKPGAAKPAAATSATIKPAAKKEPPPDEIDGLLAGALDVAADDRTESFNRTANAGAADNDADTAMFGGPSTPASPHEDTRTVESGEVPVEEKTITVKAAPKATFLKDYKLLKKLGQGGMGAVYKAHQMSLDRDVAIKVLSKELAGKPGFVQRFLREARVMAKLDHPNILRCFEIGEAQGHHFLSIEYVEGGSLDHWYKKLGTFDLGDALFAIITIARALEHAHEQGLIHRDIKPDNILLTRKGVIKVADLGLAKGSDDNLGLTRTGTGAGTPVYMAPEQARDVKHVDARCDIYALGVMLYAFLTGQAPFRGETLVDLVEAKEVGKFKPIRTFNPDVPERIDLIVDKMLAAEAKHRYATCAEVIADLDELGLANDRLSFLDAGAAAPPDAGAPPAGAAAKSAGATKSPAGAVKTQAASSAGATVPLKPKAPPFEDPKPDPNIWYWRFNDPKGRQVTKKVTTEEVLTLIKTGSIDAKGQLSRTLEGGYRAVGAYIEFETYFRGKIAEKKAGRGADKYKSMLEQIEQEEARKQRWKGLKRWFNSLGSFVGLVVWLGILAGAIVGIWYLVKRFVM